MEDIRKQIGSRLAQARKAARLHQVELGRLIGRTNVTISRWEVGSISPNLIDIPAIAAALGLEPRILAKRLFESKEE